MKKFISLMLVMAMIMSLGFVNVQADGWVLPEGAAEEPSLKFGLLSDSHIQSSASAFETAASSFADLGIDALVLNGDIVLHQATELTENAMIPKYTLLKSALKNALGIDVDAGEGLPLIYATGNHEFPQGVTTPEASETAISVFESEMKREQNTHTTVNGYHFITSGGYTYSSYAYTDEADDFDNESYLKQEILAAEKDDPTGNPIFVMMHHPIYETVKGSDAAAQRKYTEEFKNFLNEHPRVIVISAHTHLPVQNPDGIWQDGFTAVTSGYVGGGNDVWSAGHLVEVNGTEVKFYKMNYQTGQYIGEPWVIDVSEPFTFTDEAKANTNAPVFGSDAKVSFDSLTSEAVTLTWNDANVEPTAPFQDNYVEKYNVLMKKSLTGEEVFSKTVEGDYLLENATTTNSIYVDGLDQYTDYDVEITAVSPLGKESAPLTASFKTLDTALDDQYFILECEENNVNVNYNGTNLAEQGKECYIVDSAASNGANIRTNISTITWKYTPAKSGYYGFELVANGDLPDGDGSFTVGDTTIYTGEINTNGDWGVSNPERTKLGKAYMAADIEYTLTLKANNGTIALDYFKVTFEEIFEAEADENMTKLEVSGANGGYVVEVLEGETLSVPATVAERGLYKVVPVGASKGATGVISITEGDRTVTADSVLLAGDGEYAETTGAFIFMDKGNKTINLAVSDGTYTCDYISLKKLSDITTYDGIIEAELYEKSNGANCETAFANLYGNYENGTFLSAIKGTDMKLTYEFDVKSDGAYRFDILGASAGDNTSVTLTIDDSAAILAGAVPSGGWISDSTYMGTAVLTEGTHTLTVATIGGPLTINAIKFERDSFRTEYLINAETDYDTCYDTTPNGHDDQYQALNADTYGTFDVYSEINGGYYAMNVGGAIAYMVNNEWMSYKVDVDYTGYYRIFLGIKTIGAGKTMTVTVNDDEENSISKVHEGRSSNYIGASDLGGVLPYDDFGYIWLNKGENTIKIKFDNPDGSAQFDAFKLVFPEISLKGYEEGATVKLEAENAEVIKYEVSAPSKEGYVALGGPDIYHYLEWTINAEKAGTYNFSVYGGGNVPSGVISVDGVKINSGVTLNTNSKSWEEDYVTELGSVELTAGKHTIRFALTNYSMYYVDYITYTEPSGNAAVKDLTEGAYTVSADFTDWCGGKLNPDGKYDTYWASEETPVIYAAVYDADGRLSSVKSASEFTDYKTNIDSFDVLDGQTVKLLVFDKDTMKPMVLDMVFEQ